MEASATGDVLMRLFPRCSRLRRVRAPMDRLTLGPLSLMGYGSHSNKQRGGG